MGWSGACSNPETPRLLRAFRFMYSTVSHSSSIEKQAWGLVLVPLHFFGDWGGPRPFLVLEALLQAIWRVRGVPRENFLSTILDVDDRFSVARRSPPNCSSMRLAVGFLK